MEATRTNNQGNTYKYIRLEQGKWEFLQRYNWMNENGPIPEGKILCCMDGDSLNCEPGNWELKTRAEHGRSNCNLVKPVVKICPICLKEFETKLRQAKYCSDDCQREKSRIHMREFQRAKRGLRVELTRNCIVCEKEFTPGHMANKICSDECHIERQRRYNATSYNKQHLKVATSVKKASPSISKKIKANTSAKCSQCGNEFTKTSPLNELCSYRCKRDRRNELRGPYVSIKAMKEKPKLTTTCIVCGNDFTKEDGKKICSSECRIQSSKNYRKNYYDRSKASKPVKVTAVKPVKVKAVKPIKVKSIKPAKEKPIPQVIQSLNKRQKTNEKDAALNMLELNRNAPLHDREVIKKKNIVSPDLSEMEYTIHDKRMRCTYYFRTKEKYNNYLKKQEDERLTPRI